jgi:hypothetical protein
MTILQKPWNMIPLKMPQMQGAEISSKLKAQRAIVINPFQLSASGFQLSCDAVDWVFSAESYLLKKIESIVFAGSKSCWLRRLLYHRDKVAFDICLKEKSTEIGNHLLLLSL